MTPEENKITNVSVMLCLWCGFLLLMYPSTGIIAPLVAGFSGFLLVVGSIGFFILAKITENQEIQESVEIVAVNREALQELVEASLLLGSMYECGVDEWEGFDDSEKLFELKLKEAREVIGNNE